jgi:hypothetical protein
MLNPLSNIAYTDPIPTFVKESTLEGCCNGEAQMGSGGVETFIELTDTPNSYTGQAGKFVTVKNDESGLQFSPNSSSGWRPANRVVRNDSHFTDDHTYTDASLAGTNFFVYYNGSKILTETEGFQVLNTGGFTYDPTKFQFYDGEFLYMIF